MSTKNSWLREQAVEIYLTACFFLVAAVLVVPIAVLGLAHLYWDPPVLVILLVAAWYCYLFIRISICRRMQADEVGMLISAGSDLPIYEVALSVAKEMQIKFPLHILLDGTDSFAVSFFMPKFGFKMHAQVRIGFLSLTGLEADEFRSIVAHELSHIALNRSFYLWSWTRRFVASSLRLVSFRLMQQFDLQFRSMLKMKNNKIRELQADEFAALHSGRLNSAMGLLVISLAQYVVEQRILNKPIVGVGSLKAAVAQVLQGLRDTQDKAFLNDFFEYDCLTHRQGTHPSLPERVKKLGFELDHLVDLYVQRSFRFPSSLLGDRIEKISEFLTASYLKFHQEYSRLSIQDEQSHAPKPPPERN